MTKWPSQMERRYIDAADELYSAFCESATDERQRQALKEFATASNLWANHPAKCDARMRGEPVKYIMTERKD